MPHRTTCLLATMTFLAVLGSGRSACAQSVTDSRLSVTWVAQGLGSSQGTLTTGLVFVDSHTALCARRSDGVVRRLDLPPGENPPVVVPGVTVADLDIIAPSLDSQSEYGVQAMELHPQFASNGWVYIRYDRSLVPGSDTPQSVVCGENFAVSTPTDNIIQRFTWNPAGAGGNGELIPGPVIHTVNYDTRYHHGGPIVFGDDGSLFTFYGDGRREAWIAGHRGLLVSANTAPPDGVVETMACVVRLQDDGGIPADNPFDPAVPGVPAGAAAWYAYGVRNSFGLAVDPVTGALWATENGENAFDEINRIVPGFNGGSLKISGPLSHPDHTGSPAMLVSLPGSVYTDPAFAWRYTFGVTGLHFLSGSALGAAFNDAVMVGNWNNGYVYLLRLNPTRDAFVFQNPGLQDGVDDRSPLANPLTTEAAELVLGSGFGGTYSGALGIRRSPSGAVYLWTAQGRLYRFSRACPADWNQDGLIQPADVGSFVTDWFASLTESSLVGDFDGNGVVQSVDVAAFVSAWFESLATGC